MFIDALYENLSALLGTKLPIEQIRLFGSCNPFDLEWCHIGIDSFVEFSSGEVTGEYGLGDDVGRFGVANDPQGFESSVCEGGFEFVIEYVVGYSVCD